MLFRGRICVPKNPKLVQKILNEAHNGTISIHPGSNKMYNDLKKISTLGIFGISASSYNTGVEMGKSYYGFHIRTTSISEKERHYLGNCRQIDIVCTLYSSTCGFLVG
ncbi:integrase [Gossypium australe]|uniref:Integrase n=1 Tax=Gossypium australe TaxID=47621 RepID=A0A5B6VAB3_9ROSI|nr:integrase [Gossypium australe]